MDANVHWLGCFFMICLPAALLAVVVLSVYFAFFRQEAIKRRQLVKRARQDFEEARGTAHRRLLREAIERVRKQQDETHASLAATTAKRDGLVRVRRTELEAKPVSLVVESHLQ